MYRLEALADNPKRTLGVLALVLLAVGIAVGSGANFTAQSANPSNTFTAGTLTIDNSNEGAAILTASGMKPGDVATGTVDIQNSGTITGDFSLSRSALTDTPASPAMSSQLDVMVDDCGEWSGGTPPSCGTADGDVYSGTLAAMSGSYPGTPTAYSPSEQHRYLFTVTFSASADDTYQGAESTATFQWDAVQS